MSGTGKKLFERDDALHDERTEPCVSTDPVVVHEDERSLPEHEDDHSYTDFDLHDEMDWAAELAAPGKAPAPEADPAAHVEDERSPAEDESDHSYTDFDIDAEIEAKLGAAPPSPAAPEADPPRPSEPLPPHDPSAFYPEDERSSMDWEDDHSYTDFDLEAELDRAEAAAAARTVEQSAAEDVEDPDAHDEDDRSHLEHEDDHSYTDFDLHDEMDWAAQLAEARGAEKSAAPGAGASSAAETAPQGAPRATPQPGTPERLPAAGGEHSPDTDHSGGIVVPPRADDDDEDEGDDDDEDDKGEGEDDSPMTLRDHLNELRKRLGRAFFFILLAFFGCLPFSKDVFRFLVDPLQRFMPTESHFIFTAPAEAFFVELKVAFVAGLFAASPFVFYQLWAFIAPGLYKEEKLYLLPMTFFSALFFICGGAFCYFVVMPFAFEFFMSYNTELIKALPKLTETLSFVLQLLLAFGLVFELPLFIFFLARLGLVTADMLRRFRRYAVLLSVIVAAILTPPDVMSQLLMAGPLLVLYELSIMIAAVFGKKKKDQEEGAPQSA